MQLGIVVGEPSGDALAASLTRALKKTFPALDMIGVAGPQLKSLGCQALYPMERLCLMGLVEPLLKIPGLYWMRRALIQHFIENPPQVFLGVDAPDFNLGLEKILRQKKIPTVHYVSPTVWAWRRGRLSKIRAAVDLMLVMYPFEAQFYQEMQIPYCYTGHPFADEIPITIESGPAKQALGFSSSQTIIGLMPGSRNSEMDRLAKIYIETAQYCYQKNPALQFIVPLVSTAHKTQFEALCHSIAPDLPIQIFVGKTREVIAACDAVLVTSGTATLEVALYKKPMVVAYKLNPITYQIAKRMIKVPYISQPNLLAKEKLVPEFIQEDVTVQNLSAALLAQLEPNGTRDRLIRRFTEIHQELRCGASQKAAEALSIFLK